jgi:hypothetical protein
MGHANVGGMTYVIGYREWTPRILMPWRALNFAAFLGSALWTLAFGTLWIQGYIDEDFGRRLMWLGIGGMVAFAAIGAVFHDRDTRERIDGPRRRGFGVKTKDEE